VFLRYLVHQLKIFIENSLVEVYFAVIYSENVLHADAENICITKVEVIEKTKPD